MTATFPASRPYLQRESCRVCIQAIKKANKTPSDASVAARAGRVLLRDTADNAVHDSVTLRNFRPMSRTSPCCGQVARSGSRLQDVGSWRGHRGCFLGKCQRVARALRLARGSGRPFTPSPPPPLSKPGSHAPDAPWRRLAPPRPRSSS